MGGFNIFGNATTATPANWKPEPDTRGTWSVLSSCLLTLVLCLWTALHLNIPQHGRVSKQKWQKIGWLILGLLAPEIVAYTAWYQQRAAVRLTARMKAIFDESPPLVTSKNPFTRILAYIDFRGSKKSRDEHDPENQSAETSNKAQTLRRRHPWP